MVDIDECITGLIPSPNESGVGVGAVQRRLGLLPNWDESLDHVCWLSQGRNAIDGPFVLFLDGSVMWFVECTCLSHSVGRQCDTW